MEYVIKRNGVKAPFDKSKIVNAIEKAMTTTPGGIDSRVSNAIADHIAEMPDTLSVEQIQDIVIEQLKASPFADVAESYSHWRKLRQEIRDKEKTNASILEIIDAKNDAINQENSNKNPTVNSVQRDYMAGEVSKDLTARLLLDPEIVKAHEEGLIHFHDADYFAQHMHNCFKSNTRFVTDSGVKEFRDFNDGETVKVVGSDGKWHTATVKKYGKQKMQDVMLQAGRSVKHVFCTANHRWLLNDGSVTTELKEGMTLVMLPELSKYEMESKEDYQAWATGFAIGDGLDKKNDYTTIRLCGNKIRYADNFVKAGDTVTYPESYHGDAYVLHRGAFKQDFLNAKAWRFLDIKRKQHLFEGFYAADGAVKANKVATSDDRVAEMIRDISSVAGFYVSSESEVVRDTNFKKEARLIEFRFRKYQIANNLWSVKKITPYRPEIEYDAWCVEEPETHSFTLDGGIVTGNCDLVNLEDMLQNGTVISGTGIDKPHSFSTACNIATQIIAQVASNQYGGQSISLTHLAPFVDVSRKKIAAEVELEMEGLDVSAERKKEIVERRLRNEINRGVQTIQYQVVTLMTTNGQAPFITVFMYLGEARNPQEKADLAIIIEETIRQRYQGVKNEAGVWITPAFPKLIYVLEEDNIRPGTPYYYLTELAAKCTAKRMVPDYISEKKMLELKVDKNGEGHCYTCMGCRSFLTPYVDPETGKPKYYGRFNQGVVTINLVDVALSSGGNFEKFWKIFDERLALCHKALQARHQRLMGTPSDAAPILWQYGALARLKKGEKIDKLLFGGYSTISLGYAGLYECVKYMTGKSHTDAGAKPFALSVMQHMNDKCNAWKKAENMDYSLYGTPLESTTYKFAKCLQKRFGIVKGITDKNYITNSYHVHVSEPIDAFTKLKFEADFQRLSPGGAISYVEVPNMQDNLEAVISVLQFIYDNIMYAELNTKSDYCQCCGYDGEIKIVEDNGKLVWECPNCGNRDQSKMNVARRTCGYIGSNFWNQGRTQEIRDRVVHLSDN